MYDLRMDLTTEEMLLVNSEVEKRKRSLLVAYLLFFSSVHLVRTVSISKKSVQESPWSYSSS